MKRLIFLFFSVVLSFSVMFLSFEATAEAAGGASKYSTSKLKAFKAMKINANKQRKMSNMKIPILMYHHLDEGNQNALTVDPVVFEKQMQFLKDNGYTTITDHDLSLFYKGKKLLPAKPVMITFDDGYYSNYQYAYPILQKLNMKATIFLITDAIENPDLHPSPYPKLNWSQVEEMSKSGLVSFQSHTNDMHKSIAGLRNQGIILGPVQINKGFESMRQYEQRVLNDLLKSKVLITQHTGKPVISFSYPFGSYSAESERLVKQAGFQISYTTDFGHNLKSNGSFLLKRVNVHGNASAEHILVLIDKILK